MELAKVYFSQAIKLNPNNIRALYGLLLVGLKLYDGLIEALLQYIVNLYEQVANNIALSAKCPASKKKDATKLSSWASSQIQKRYATKTSDKEVKNVAEVLGQLQLET